MLTSMLSFDQFLFWQEMTFNTNVLVSLCPGGSLYINQEKHFLYWSKRGKHHVQAVHFLGRNGFFPAQYSRSCKVVKNDLLRIHKMWELWISFKVNGKVRSPTTGTTQEQAKPGTSGVLLNVTSHSYLSEVKLAKLSPLSPPLEASAIWNFD